jgi:hypothetical protein
LAAIDEAAEQIEQGQVIVKTLEELEPQNWRYKI